jgi:hypothetical protein
VPQTKNNLLKDFDKKMNETVFNDIPSTEGGPPMNDAPSGKDMKKSDWPKFSEIPEPKMAALYVGNGSTSKPFQSFLDGHPELYLVPAYPLIYLYPHWEQWQDELKDDWTWDAIIDAFCIKHASVIDTRRIPGFNGLTSLGGEQEGHLEIDEDLFQDYLAHLLNGELIRSRTFVLAVHYAYAFCNGQDLSQKSVLLYHIHVPDYLRRYLIKDFPDLFTIGCVRDPRSNLGGRFYNSYSGVDDKQFNRTDALIYRRRTYYFVCELLYDGLEIVRGFDKQRTRVFRAEDLHYRQAELMDSAASFLGISTDPCLETLTFGGKLWWGDAIYKMKPLNQVNPRIVSEDWQKKIPFLDWYVMEGLFYDYFQKYGHTAYKYRTDSLLNRVFLFLAMLMPAQFERQIIMGYINPKSILDFMAACRDEATGKLPLKDYSFNASYRHKITTRDLNMWKPRWYVTLVQRIQRFREENADSLLVPPLMGLGIALYTGANLCRYFWSILLMPVMLGNRLRLMMGTFFRRLRNENILPDYL